jgi:hypothetical protein
MEAASDVGTETDEGENKDIIMVVRRGLPVQSQNAVSVVCR